MTLLDGLAEFAASLDTATLPPPVRASVAQRVLDIVGVSIAATALPTSAAVIAHAHEQGGAGHAWAIGAEAPLPAPSAAFVGGVLAHSLDYDDTHLPSVLHPSASVVPAAIAAAQYAGRSGSDVVSAIAAGLEICVRLGMAGYDAGARDSLYFRRGQHATSICGAIACAATAARLIGLGTDGIGHAMGLAVSMG
ncbi:MAG: MmgE/PrpD family protein, partial [Actinomycetota bacterium]